MEHAQILPSALAGSDCAVYVGISGFDYGMRGLDDLAVMTSHSMTGNTLSIAANRISYVFDLHGPSLAVDTACSSSLVALHQACNSLRSGEVSTALVGG
jgi:acyl transferase domain-containing protein